MKNSRFKGFVDRPYYDKLVIPIDIFQRIRAFTLEAKGEISGFGRTLLADEGLSLSGSAIVVKEFDLFKQECNPAHTTLKSEDMTQMYVGVARSGGDPSSWNFWWHSHVDFGTGFSVEDDNTMKKITQAKNGQEGSMLVALCTNKLGDYDATVYQNGKRLMDRLPLMIAPKLDDEFLKDIRSQIKEKVTFENYKPKFRNKDYLSNIPIEIPPEFATGLGMVEADMEFDTEFEFGTYAPLRNINRPTENMSKNQRRKAERYNKDLEKQPFQREKGWKVRA